MNKLNAKNLIITTDSYFPKKRNDFCFFRAQNLSKKIFSNDYLEHNLQNNDYFQHKSYFYDDYLSKKF